MRPVFLFVLVSAISVVSPVLRAEPQAKPEDPALTKRLEKIDAQSAKVKDLTASFKQQKFTALLRKPLASSGTVRVKGAKVRWDTLKPEPAVLLLDGREIKMYYPDQKLLEIYPLDQRLGELAASPLPRLATLRELFTIEQIPLNEFADEGATDDERIALQLTPREEELAGHVKGVRTLLDVKRARILKIETTDADDDRTVITFSDMKTNTGIKDDELDLVVPDDVKVNRPLEGAGAED